MDDTAWHASIAGMFKTFLPIPHPTLCGEILPPSHRMVHCLVAFYSILLNKNSLDIFFFSVPFLVTAFLVFQTFSFLHNIAKQSISISFAGTLFTCLGFTGINLLFPFFGQKLINLPPEPLPWIFWRLPGFGFSLLFSLPLVLILTNQNKNNLKPTTKYFLLSTILAAGLYSKPAIPICIICAYSLINMYKKIRGSPIDFYATFFSITFILIFYYFFLTGKTYGFDVEIPFKPFQTFNSVFKSILAIDNVTFLKILKIVLFLSGFFLVPLYCSFKVIKNKQSIFEYHYLLLISGILGIAAFLFLFSPMGAEYQFGLFGIFLFNILFFSLIKKNKKHFFAYSFLLCGLGFYLIHFWINSFPTYDPLLKKEVNRDIVDAMNWLNKNTKNTEGFFLNDQHYRNKMANNAVYCAISERPSYISCFRYTPETYINIYRGKPSPWSTRLTNNYKIFNGDIEIMKSEAQRFNIQYLVLNKNIRDLQKIRPSKILFKKFENSQIAIYKINLSQKQK